MAELLSKSEYAKHRGVSPAMVTHWTRDERIVIIDGKVDVGASDAALSATLDPARGGQKRRARQVVRDTPNATDSYTRVRTAREAYRAKTEEMEYRKRLGELVERRAYDKALTDGVSPILTALDTLSARIGHALAAETDVRKVQIILDDAIGVMRQDLAETLRRMSQDAAK